MLYYHDMKEVVGEWTKMMEDEKGLYVEGKLWVTGDLKIETAVKAYNILRSNSVKGLSIGFYDRGSVEKTLMDGSIIRELQEIDLLEVSIAPWSMEPKAMVTSVKSLAGNDGQVASKREVEKALRDAGLSARQAKAFISGGYDAMTRDESAPYAEILASLDRISTQLQRS
jgi:HK97 family phage prohead protease